MVLLVVFLICLKYQVYTFSPPDNLPSTGKHRTNESLVPSNATICSDPAASVAAAASNQIVNRNAPYPHQTQQHQRRSRHSRLLEAVCSGTGMSSDLLLGIFDPSAEFDPDLIDDENDDDGDEEDEIRNANRQFKNKRATKTVTGSWGCTKQGNELLLGSSNPVLSNDTGEHTNDYSTDQHLNRTVRNGRQQQ